MGSSGKKKTTMAKLDRERRLRERRLNKQAKRDARKQAPSDTPEPGEGPLEVGIAQSAPPDLPPTAVQPAVQPPVSDVDPREKEVALLRLRDAPDEELAVFESSLRDDALEAGATEREMRAAQRDHPGHSA
jgi:hypothetical protein